MREMIDRKLRKMLIIQAGQFAGISAQIAVAQRMARARTAPSAAAAGSISIGGCHEQDIAGQAFDRGGRLRPRSLRRR